MKKLLLAITVFASLQASAQKKVENEKLNNVKLGIGSILLSTAAIAYERQINESSSAQFQINYTGTKIPGADTKIRGIILTPEYRYYPKKEGFVGFYVGPYIRYQNLNLESTISGTTEKASLSTFGGGLLLGKKWAFNNITIDFFAGPNYNTGTAKYEGSATEDDFDFKGGLNGFGIRTGLSVGILF